MSKWSKLLYSMSIFAFAGGIWLEWSEGNRVIWPACALIWCVNSLLCEHLSNREKDGIS
jgi:hypothetical protein